MNMTQYLVIYVLLIFVLALFPVARIFKRAGLNQLWCVLLFIPYVGGVVCTLVLGFSKWPAFEKEQ